MTQSDQHAPVGIHIAYDLAEPGTDYTVVTIVASDGMGSHATYIAKTRKQYQAAHEAIGNALARFGERLARGEMPWVKEQDDTQHQPEEPQA